MIKAGVIGATGYAGGELVRILMHHPEAQVNVVTSQRYIGQPLSEIYENFREINTLVCEEENIEKMADSCDVIFLALPHGVAAKRINAKILEKVKVIDLGADFRLKDAAVYEQWYGLPNDGTALLPEAVYGLCEQNREKIKKARLIANPGCYTTCSILSLSPLVAEGLIDNQSIIVDAKSGVSGAGRATELSSLFCECNESVKAYKIAAHRHTPEIEEQLGYQCDKQCGKEIIISFTPHLIPMNRGILVTAYASLLPDVTEEIVRAAYEKYYQNEYFVRLTKKGVMPETKWVRGSNFVDIGFTIDKRTNRIVVVGAIDNLVKGAAGQAVQNMNLLFGLDEKTGLTIPPAFPG